MTLSDEEKAGATDFFTKVKEELEYIPAQLKVLEYWQEKAVFEQDGEEHIVAAPRSAHPLGKCIATASLLAISLPPNTPTACRCTGRSRCSNTGSRSQPNQHGALDYPPERRVLTIIDPMREAQNGSDYLQADETRIQVLKEDGKKAQSDKWMWVNPGGWPPASSWFCSSTIPLAVAECAASG